MGCRALRLQELGGAEAKSCRMVAGTACPAVRLRGCRAKGVHKQLQEPGLAAMTP